jgi:hypothetical protein
MAGVVIVSAMVGVIFRFFSSLLTRNWVVIAMGLIALKDFVYIPRNLTFSWVIDVFSLTYLAYYIAVYFAALFLARLGAASAEKSVLASSPAPSEELHMKVLLLLTNSFPYGTGESFLSPELNYARWLR